MGQVLRSQALTQLAMLRLFQHQPTVSYAAVMQHRHAKVTVLTDLTSMHSLVTLLVLDERLRRKRLYGALALFTAILIVGSIPGARQEIGMLASGLILHSVAYATLTLLIFTGLSGGRTRRAAMAFCGAVCMGALDEAVQSALPYRVGSLGDLAVDSIAALVTASLLWTLLPQPVSSTTASRN